MKPDQIRAKSRAICQSTLDNLLSFMEQHQISKAELGRAIGIHAQNVNKLFTGNSMMKIDTLIAIKIALEGLSGSTVFLFTNKTRKDEVSTKA